MKLKTFLTAFGLLVVAALWGFAKFRAAKLESESSLNQPKRTLHLFAMSDYFPDDFIREFEAKNGCKVRYDNFSSNEELLAKLQAGATGYDVIVPSDYTVRLLIAGKLITPLDKTKLPHFKNLSPDFIQVPYDPGANFSVPYTWGTTGLIYNDKKIKPKSDSWDLLFDKEVSGHIALLDDEREVFGAMLKKMGYSVNTQNKSEVRAAQELLLTLKPSVRLFASDPKQHLLSEDVWVAHIYSGDAHQLSRTNPEFKYIAPKDGGVRWIDTLAIPSSAKNADLAYAFIDMILQTETAKIITEKLLYNTPNFTLENLLSQDDLKASALMRMNSDKLEFLKDLGPLSDYWDQLWTEAKSR